MKEIVINGESKTKLLDKARLLITVAIYLITAGTLMDYVSTPVLLKVIGFALAGHAFFYLWKSTQQH
jgi:hypothetical protein